MHKAAVLAHFNARSKSEKEASRERATASRLRKEITECWKVAALAPK